VSLTRLAGPALTDLQASTGETVNLAQLLGGRVVYAAILEGKYAMRMSAGVGQEAPAHATSVGKALLSRLPLDEARAIAGHEPYQSFTPKTITRWTELETELKRAASRGYAEDDEETEPHVACIASAILGRDGYPVGAISVSGLGARMPKTNRPQLGRAVKRWCDGISVQLGADDHRGIAKAL